MEPSLLPLLIIFPPLNSEGKKRADAGEIALPAADTVAAMFTKTLHPFMPDRLNEPNGYSALCGLNVSAAFQVVLLPSEFQDMKILITHSLHEQHVLILFIANLPPNHSLFVVF